MLQRQRGSSVDDSEFMEACFKALLDQCEETSSTRQVRPRAPAPTGNQSNSTEVTGETPVVIGNRVLTEAEIERLLAPRYQVAVTVTEDRKQGWQHGAHSTTVLTPAEVERALCDSVDIGCIDDDVPGPAKRSIPKRIKRHVLHRDGYRCRVPGCSATANIDAHHIEFFVNGGQHTVANVITLCEGHHLALHEGGLEIEGDALTAKFVFKPQNKFKIEARAVECAAALRKQGIAKGLIKSLIDATRTHVGMQDLTIRQWVDIALTKLPHETRDG